jgi:hypothetical protein
MSWCFCHRRDKKAKFFFDIRASGDMKAPAKEPKIFTQDEAETKLQKRVRCVKPFSNVPAGSIGKVVHTAPGENGYELAIHWDIPSSSPDGTRPLLRWVGKKEYDQCVAEIE